MTQKFIKQIARIFKDRESEVVKNEPRLRKERLPSERLLVSYDTFLEYMKKQNDSTDQIAKPNHWYNTISKPKKWRKRRFTNPFHHNHHDQPADVTIKSQNQEKTKDTINKPHFLTFRQKKRQYVRIVSPELSEKVEIGSYIRLSYSLQSLSELPPPTFLRQEKENVRPRSSTSLSYSSIFSKSTPHLTSWNLQSDQETVHTSFTSHEEDDSLHSIVRNNSLKHQQSKLEPKLDYDLYASNDMTDKNGIGLAEQVKAILGDAISLADEELEQSCC